MKLLTYKSLGQLRADAQRWDDLWWRSDVTLPTARAELVAQWVEHFALRRRFAAMAVEDEGRLVAAIPFVAAEFGGMFAGALPKNCWSDGGELLIDGKACSDDALHCLAEGLRELPWALYTCEGVITSQPSWQKFLNVLRLRGAPVSARPQFRVGLIDIGRDWGAYEAAWSGNHRRALRKTRRKAEKSGALEMCRHRDIAPRDAAALLEEFCEVEDRSWKGQEGTSILRTPRMFEFFRRQAEQLAEWGQIEVFFLRQNGQAIAAEFGYAAKDVYHSHKIGYDVRYRDVGPGQLLRGDQLQDFFQEGRYRHVDLLGVLGEANAKWATRGYEVDRLLIGSGSWLGSAAAAGLDAARLLKRRLTRGPAPTYEGGQPGAASYAREGEFESALSKS